MDKEKIVGYLLLSAGLAIIAFAAINAYNVFTNKAQPVELFAGEGISIDLGNFVENAPRNADLNQELVQAELINKPLNLFFHLILMGFVVTVGFKVASLGVMLVRSIKVNLRESSHISEKKNPNIPPWKS